MSETTNVMNSEVVKRLLCYVSYDTQSKDESSEVPSTQKQFDLAKVLKKELEEIGALGSRGRDLYRCRRWCNHPVRQCRRLRPAYLRK